MKVKQIRFILGFLILQLAFQNCGGAGSTNSVEQDSKTDTAGGTNPLDPKSPTSNTSKSGINSGNARGITRSPASGSSTFGGISSGSAGSASGGVSTGGTSSTIGGGTCLGCSSTGSGGSSIIGSGDVAFKISTQPVSRTIAEGSEFFVGVSVVGGRSPYKFKWFLNNNEILPKYDYPYYESYSDALDRVYKEGDYHVQVTDSAGATLVSSKAQIRMIAKACGRGNYFIDLTKRTNTNDGYFYFNDYFYYNGTKFFASQSSPVVSQLGLNNYLRFIKDIGFGYFTINESISNAQSFTVSCATDIPTVHRSECATNNLSKCPYNVDSGYSATHTYEGSVSFTCRNGYIEFKSNSCRLVAPPPPPPDIST